MITSDNMRRIGAYEPTPQNNIYRFLLALDHIYNRLTESCFNSSLLIFHQQFHQKHYSLSLIIVNFRSFPVLSPQNSHNPVSWFVVKVSCIAPWLILTADEPRFLVLCQDFFCSLYCAMADRNIKKYVSI